VTDEALTAVPQGSRPWAARMSGVLSLPILRGAESFEVAASMTVVLLFFYTEGNWYVRIPIVVIAVFGILHRPLLADNNFWFALAVFSAGALYQNWYRVDNHKWLICYWCIALSAASADADRTATLRRNARWLIALAFLFATAWKLMSKDFLDGTFFYYTLLTEGRFDTITKLVAGAPGSAFTAAGNALHAIRHVSGTSTASEALYSSNRLLLFARMMTWWTLFIEAAIGISFALPRRFVIARIRDAFLLVFLFTTYTSATVVGFGWVLAIMGFAQSEEEARGRRLLYVAAFVLIFIYTGPWSDFISGVMARLASLAGA